MRVNQLKHQVVQHGTSSKSLVTNSNNGIVWTDINIRNSTIPLIYIIRLFLFIISPLIHLHRIRFILRISDMHEFWICTSTKAQNQSFFWQMMYYSRLVLVVLLSHHSLGLVDYFSSFFFFIWNLVPSFVRFVFWRQFVNFLFSLIAYNFFLLTVITVIFHSHIEDPVLYTVNYNTWQEGCRGDQRKGGCITQHNIQPGIQHNTANYSHPYGVYVSKKSKRLTLCVLLPAY